MSPEPSYTIFRPAREPREGAFVVLAPKGWAIQGGILRANLMQEMVNAQNIECKHDFAIQREPQGSVMLRWCPEMKYCDMSRSPAALTGLVSYPPGSNYCGMIVMPYLGAVQFLSQIMVPWAHPQGSGYQIIEQKARPEMVQAYLHNNRAIGGLPGNRYDSAYMIYTYTESGVQYKELAAVTCEYLDPAAGGMWSNKDTIYLRAPVAEFDKYRPMLEFSYRSLRIDKKWLAREHQSQAILSQMYRQAQQGEQQRIQSALATQRYINDTLKGIAEHRDRTQAEIRNDMYLNLTGQEEYINPYDGQVDTGSNQWAHRWTTGTGEIFYTDDQSQDPNNITELRDGEWKKSEIRQRFPG